MGEYWYDSLHGDGSGMMLKHDPLTKEDHRKQAVALISIDLEAF